MKQVILITGASSGFGALAARALAHCRAHRLRQRCARRPGATRRRSPRWRRYAARARRRPAHRRAGRASQRLGRRRRAEVMAQSGPARRADPQRRPHVVRPGRGLHAGAVRRALRHQRARHPARQPRRAAPLRKRSRGLVVWVSSSSARGRHAPFLAPYFAAKAGDGLARRLLRRELSRWGIETSIIVPGAFTKGTNHFAHSGAPADKARAAEYASGPYAGVADQASKVWRRSSPRMPMSQPWRRLSSTWSTCRSGSGRSACTSIRRRTEPRSSTASPIACERKSSGASASRICCRRELRTPTFRTSALPRPHHHDVASMFSSGTRVRLKPRTRGPRAVFSPARRA